MTRRRFRTRQAEDIREPSAAFPIRDAFKKFTNTAVGVLEIAVLVAVKRRVVILRRPLRQEASGEKKKHKASQLSLDLPETTHQGVRHEYAVLVTSMQGEVRTAAQLYRDRGDSENNFDELKNQWGWSGFTRPGPEPLSDHGAPEGADLQLVDNLHAIGDSGPARRSDPSRPLALHGIASRRGTLIKPLWRSPARIRWHRSFRRR